MRKKKNCIKQINNQKLSLSNYASNNQNNTYKGIKMKVNVDNKFKEIQSFLGTQDVFLANHELFKSEFFSTGSLYLNQILGIGGWPKGRIVELYGSESCGKSTLALKAIAECQKNNGSVVYVDSEGSLDLKWAKTNGVDVEKLIVAKPDTGEQAVTIINALVKTKLVDLIVIDSVASMTPKVEIESNVSDQSMGLHARLMSKAMRLIQSSLLHNNRTCVMFINQTRMKIGITYGPSLTTTGGNALKFAASIRVELKKQEAIRESADIVGYYIKATVIKNKLAAPMRSALLPFYFKNGFDALSELINDAIKFQILIKKGTWFYFKEQNIGQGLKFLREKLENDSKLLKEITDLVADRNNVT